LYVSTITGDSTPVFNKGEQIFEFVKDSIVSVMIIKDNEQTCRGSGSVIGTDDSGLTYVLTNKHVVKNEDTRSKGQYRIEIQQHSGARFYAKLDFCSREHDLALLSVKGMEKYARPLKLALKSNLKIGEPVYAIGSPLGLKDTFTAGVISALRNTYLQTDATTYYGSSGGPLVDKCGSLCAVVTRGHDKKNFAFGIYSDSVLEMLEERREKQAREETKKS